MRAWRLGHSGHERSLRHRLIRRLPGGQPLLGLGALTAELIDVDHFQAVDLRVGRVTAVDEFPEARVPAWKLTIDFGPEVGVKRSSAQITNYDREQLEGRMVVAVVNFPPRQIGPFSSEVLVLGALDEANKVVLLRPDADVEPGARIS
jgi:tRNA-binding protein